MTDWGAPGITPDSETDPLAIRKDGTSTTTAVIPFAKGIDVSPLDYIFATFHDTQSIASFTIGTEYDGIPAATFNIGAASATKAIFIDGSTFADIVLAGVDWHNTFTDEWTVLAARGTIEAGRDDQPLLIKGRDGIWPSEFDPLLKGGIVLLHGGAPPAEDPSETNAGLVAIAPDVASIPSSARGSYAFYVAGNAWVDGDIIANNLSSGGSLLKTNASTKAVENATAGTDYEAPISAGTSSQYWRGDKTFQTLNQAAVAGLTTSDAPTFASLTASGTAITVGNVTGASATADWGVSGSYEGGDGIDHLHVYRIYAVKDVGGVEVYSASYTEVSEYDDGFSHMYEPYHIDLAWSAVTGATKYRIFKYEEQDYGSTILKNYNFYAETTGTTFADTGPSVWAAGTTAVPSTNYTNSITLNGQIANIYGDTNVYGDPIFYGSPDFKNAIKLYGNKFLDAPVGLDSVYIGEDSGPNATGYANVGIGGDTFFSATTAGYSVAIGRDALKSVVDGTLNVAIGYLAGYKVTTGNNVFIGADSGWNQTSGGGSVFIGAYSGSSVTSGVNNLFFGYFAGQSITTGARNIGLGGLTFGGSPVGTNESIAIGFGATPTGNNQALIGSFSAPVYDIYLGAGPVQNSIAANTVTINATGGFSTNRAAFNLNLAAGRGTGTGTPGTMKLQTAKLLGSGTTLQTLYDRISILASEIVVNDASEDMDFRVESDGNANMLFVDAGKNRVGVGGVPGAFAFDVTGTSRLQGNTTIGVAGAGVDYTLTFDGESNDGVITWMEDEDYFQFNDGILMQNAEELFFRSTGVKVYSSATNTLDLVATNVNVTGALKATDYYSGDGTQGATTTVNLSSGEALVFKDGLFISYTPAP